MGRALREFLPDALYMGRGDCDVTNDRQLNDVFQREQPQVVIHAAALTDHQHPDAGEIIQTNIMGTELVARYCRAFGAKIVYLSTHYVYPGETGNYKETDLTKPIGTYAWSKLAGEGWAQIVPDWLIVRGSWYTYETRIRRWLRAAYTDAFCGREPAAHSARKIEQLVRLGATGTYNIGGPRRSFWRIAVDEGYTPYPAELSSPRIQQAGTPYLFPADSSVNTEKYEALVAAR